MTTQYMRSLAYVFSEINRTMEQCLQAFGNGDRSALKAHVPMFNSKLKAYMDLLPPADHPAWLSALHVAANRYEANEQNALELLRTLVAYIPRIAPVDDPKDWRCDFDKIFEELRDREELPQLFDVMIKALEDIIAMDVIDFRGVTDALERLVEVLKQNKHGSYVATATSLNFAWYASTFLQELVKGIPVIGAAVATFERAKAEAQGKLDRIRDETKTIALDRLVSEGQKARIANSIEMLNALSAPKDAKVIDSLDAKEVTPPLLDAPPAALAKPSEEE